MRMQGVNTFFILNLLRILCVRVCLCAHLGPSFGLDLSTVTAFLSRPAEND